MSRKVQRFYYVADLKQRVIRQPTKEDVKLWIVKYNTPDSPTDDSSSPSTTIPIVIANGQVGIHETKNSAGATGGWRNGQALSSDDDDDCRIEYESLNFNSRPNTPEITFITSNGDRGQISSRPQRQSITRRNSTTPAPPPAEDPLKASVDSSFSKITADSARQAASAIPNSSQLAAITPDEVKTGVDLAEVETDVQPEQPDLCVCVDLPGETILPKGPEKPSSSDPDESIQQSPEPEESDLAIQIVKVESTRESPTKRSAEPELPDPNIPTKKKRIGSVSAQELDELLSLQPVIRIPQVTAPESEPVTTKSGELDDSLTNSIALPPHNNEDGGQEKQMNTLSPIPVEPEINWNTLENTISLECETYPVSVFNKNSPPASLQNMSDTVSPPKSGLAETSSPNMFRPKFIEKSPQKVCPETSKEEKDQNIKPEHECAVAGPTTSPNLHNAESSPGSLNTKASNGSVPYNPEEEDYIQRLKAFVGNPKLSIAPMGPFILENTVMVLRAWLRPHEDEETVSGNPKLKMGTDSNAESTDRVEEQDVEVAKDCFNSGVDTVSVCPPATAPDENAEDEMRRDRAKAHSDILNRIQELEQLHPVLQAENERIRSFFESLG